MKNCLLNPETGVAYNKLTLIKFSGFNTNKKPVPLWECVCECGIKKNYIATKVKSGSIKSCGCLNRQLTDNLINLKVDKLIVQSFAFYKKGKRYWNCLCECGKAITRSQGDLLRKSLHERSCGCLKGSKKIKDITGTKYGELIVIKYKSRTKRGGGSIWECLCNCGKIVDVQKCNLTHGGTRSCGCIKTRMLQNPDRSNNVARSGKATLKGIMKSYKRGAILRGIDFLLNEDDIASLIYKNCFYCGSLPSNVAKAYYKTKDETSAYNGIDRVDNNIGYTQDNCITCCKICNYSKRDLSKKDFYNWVKTLYNNLLEKGEIC